MKLYTWRLLRLSCVLGGWVCCYNSGAAVGLCAGVTMAFSREELSKATPRELESGATHTTCITAVKTSHTYSCGLFKMILQHMHHHTQRESIIPHNAWCISVCCLIQKHWLKWSKTYCLPWIVDMFKYCWTLRSSSGTTHPGRRGWGFQRVSVNIAMFKKHTVKTVSHSTFICWLTHLLFLLSKKENCSFEWFSFVTAHLSVLWC